jgi:hypothetical protein
MTKADGELPLPIHRNLVALPAWSSSAPSIIGLPAL